MALHRNLTRHIDLGGLKLRLRYLLKIIVFFFSYQKFLTKVLLYLRQLRLIYPQAYYNQK